MMCLFIAILQMQNKEIIIEKLEKNLRKIAGERDFLMDEKKFVSQELGEVFFVVCSTDFLFYRFLSVCKGFQRFEGYVNTPTN